MFPRGRLRYSPQHALKIRAVLAVDPAMANLVVYPIPTGFPVRGIATLIRRSVRSLDSTFVREPNVTDKALRPIAVLVLPLVASDEQAVLCRIQFGPVAQRTPFVHGMLFM